MPSFRHQPEDGYKWIERYEQLGPAGLLDRAPVASTHPHATPTEVLDALFLLRKEHPSWGVHCGAVIYKVPGQP